MKAIITEIEVTAKNGTKAIINNNGEIITKDGTFKVDGINWEEKVMFKKEDKLISVQLIKNAQIAKAILRASEINAVLVDIDESDFGQFGNCGKEFRANDKMVCYCYSK